MDHRENINMGGGHLKKKLVLPIILFLFGQDFSLSFLVNKKPFLISQKKKKKTFPYY